MFILMVTLWHSFARTSGVAGSLEAKIVMFLSYRGFGAKEQRCTHSGGSCIASITMMYTASLHLAISAC